MIICSSVPNILLISLLWIFLEIDVTVKCATTHVYQSTPTYIDNQIYYEYRYWIEDAESGVVSERWESRLGDYVKGRYSFVEPGGSVRTVHYEVDGGNGFRAIVHTNKPGSDYLSRQQYLQSQKNLQPY